MRSLNDVCVVLGIESTAHTFSASIIKGNSKEADILSDIREVYIPPEGSGIHPREASRHHSEKAPKVLRDALNEANLKINDVDAIAFSAGPGLGPCLRVGAVIARTISVFFSKPLVPVNHAIGHIELASMLTGAINPVILLVSGGHTLISAFNSGRWRIFGETLDITVGQLIDQFGRELGFSSPCGRKVESLAGDSSHYISLPYSVKGNDVSLSGLLTAAKRSLMKNVSIQNLASSIQENAFSMLTEVVERAMAFSGKEEVLLTGGVAANKTLQKMLTNMCKSRGGKLFTIPINYSGDCGAQIAWTGLLYHLSGFNVNVAESVIRQSWRIDQVDAIWRS